MTNKEAIRILNGLSPKNTENDLNVEGIMIGEALCMAIKALSQEPCDDAISREAVLNAIEHEDKWLLAAKGHNGLTEIAFSGLKARVDALPSVTQKSETVTEFADRCRECGARYGKLLEQKTGKWKVVGDGYGDSAYICECSECKDTV